MDNLCMNVLCFLETLIGLGLIMQTYAFVAPLEEHRLLYGIFCLFGSPAFILKTLLLLKCVRQTL